MPIFGRPRYSAVKVKKVQIPPGRWMKCSQCQELIDAKAFENALKVCPRCKHHYQMSAREKVSMMIDEGTFEETDSHLAPLDPLGFVDQKRYTERQKEAQAKSNVNEAVTCGFGESDGKPVAFAAMDFAYMGGSMGSVVGERITRLIERATEERYPLVIMAASGGARMQESIYSLMQMAKTSGALAYFNKAGLLFISILTNPTTGGTTASFASLGDIIIAEPGALIGFAGPRVIRETIRQELPEGFQRSEFLLDHGMVDMVVPRREMKASVSKLIRFFVR